MLTGSCPGGQTGHAHRTTEQSIGERTIGRHCGQQLPSGVNKFQPSGHERSGHCTAAQLIGGPYLPSFDPALATATNNSTPVLRHSCLNAIINTAVSCDSFAIQNATEVDTTGELN